MQVHPGPTHLAALLISLSLVTLAFADTCRINDHVRTSLALSDLEYSNHELPFSIQHQLLERRIQEPGTPGRLQYSVDATHPDSGDIYNIRTDSPVFAARQLANRYHVSINGTETFEHVLSETIALGNSLGARMSLTSKGKYTAHFLMDVYANDHAAHVVREKLLVVPNLSHPDNRPEVLRDILRLDVRFEEGNVTVLYGNPTAVQRFPNMTGDPAKPDYLGLPIMTSHGLGIIVRAPVSKTDPVILSARSLPQLFFGEKASANTKKLTEFTTKLSQMLYPGRELTLEFMRGARYRFNADHQNWEPL